ncbi:MAG TPA: TetR/AcrR family transcriptional regulator [Nocardioidaceae bacterium]|nr:TetR/AcrR family transcriptional regulator [Nocardioidaceae bacterium]
MSTPPARRGRPGYDQETVLRTAIDLFIRQGYDGTSMGDLARELGFSKSAIYHHVPSKQHLLQQALDEALDGLNRVLDEARGDTAYDRLQAGVRSAVHVLVDHLPAVTLLLRVHGNSEAELDAMRRRREIDDKLARLVRAAAREGALRDDVPADLASKLLFGMVNSLIEWVRPDGRYDKDALANAIATIAFDGLIAQDR